MISLLNRSDSVDWFDASYEDRRLTQQLILTEVRSTQIRVWFVP